MEMTTKRWVWLGLGVFAVIALCAGGIGALVWGGYRMVADNDAYRLAAADATASPEVIERVGAVSKVEIDWSGGTHLSTRSSNGVDSGDAVYSLKATGPRGVVPVCAVLSLHGEAWRMDQFVVGKPCTEVDVTKGGDGEAI
jgi:hypothetical protein